MSEPYENPASTLSEETPTLGHENKAEICRCHISPCCRACATQVAWYHSDRYTRYVKCNMNTTPRQNACTMVKLIEKLWRGTGKRVRELTSLRRTETVETVKEHADVPASHSTMSQANGIHREQTPIDTTIVPQGRVVSNSIMRQGAKNHIEKYPSHLTYLSCPRAHPLTRLSSMVLGNRARQHGQIRESH